MLRLFQRQLQARTVWRLVLLCFFLSGACALIYEIAWLRVLGLVFGNTTFATSTVLAGYMAGLGFGAVYYGKRIDEGGNPLHVYAWLEGGIGLYAFLTPFIWKLIGVCYVAFYRMADPSFLAFSLFRFAIAFLALLLPTFLMGGTLPVLAKYFVRERKDTARNIGRLYALNTFGAVLGVLLCGFFLLYGIGVWQTVILAGILNILVFLLWFRSPGEFIRDPHPGVSVGSQDAGGQVPGPQKKWFSFLLLFFFGVSGAVSMMYEIAWTRILAVLVGSSIHAFSIMLATFLLGIALGSYLFSVLARRLKVDLGIFSFLQMMTAIFALVGMNQFDDMPFYFVKIFEWSGKVVPLIEFGKFILCSSVMILPTICIGALFACFIHVYRHTDSLGSEVGIAYFSNTVGTILGSVLTGFFVIPRIGIQATLIAAAAANAGIGIMTFFMLSRNFNWRRALSGVLLLFLFVSTVVIAEPWDPVLITCGASIRPYDAGRMNRQEFLDSLSEKETLYYKEGISSTVSVNRLRDNISIAVNGKPDASTHDAFTQFLLGHLPMMLHQDPQKVLVIGLGSGSTMAAVAAYPVKEIHVAEIEEAVIEGSHFFRDLNRKVLGDPRVRMFINDGRNVLLVRPDKYDVIISEPSNPWMAGVANLFSLEHYQTMRERLLPGGLVCQWLHAYSMEPEDLRMIIRTFAEVYPHINLWTSYFPDLMMIGSVEPLVIDFERIRRAFDNPVIRGDFLPYGIRAPAGLFSSFWLDNEALRNLSRGAKINSDNNPYLEFSAPRNLYRDTLERNFRLLNSYRQKNLFPQIENLHPPLHQNAAFFAEVARSYIEKGMLGDAEMALRIAKNIDEGDLRFLEVLGILKYKTGDKELSKKAFAAALRMDTHLASAHYYLGRMLAAEGLPDMATAELTQAVVLEEDNKEYLSRLANYLSERGEYDGALQCYSAMIQRKYDVFESLTAMQDIAIRKGYMDYLEEITGKLVSLYPKYIEGHQKLAKAYLKAGQPERAIRDYRALLNRFPDHIALYTDLAEIYSSIGRMDQVYSLIEEACRRNPKLRENPEVRKIVKLKTQREKAKD